jgi:cytochrome oxidase Cu insertion factor (SCO1/SenC/PrrC family)
MKKTIFLTLLSLLLLVGCNSEETGQTPSGEDAGGTTDAPNTDTDSQATDAEVGFEVGNRAPEITGEDIDGVSFKLSDYRGKVVVLDFWGDW